jgi:hypothetical protein
MKNLHYPLPCFFLASLLCCQPSSSTDDTKTDAPAVLDSLAFDSKNLVNKELLKGKWRSVEDARYQIYLYDEPEREGYYSAIYEGKTTEEGLWEIPVDCVLCSETTENGCFLFQNNEGKTCCSIVKITKDSFQYFIPATGSKLLSFVRT